MAKVLISFYQTPINHDFKNLLCFYESLVKALKENGNSVLLLNTAFFQSAWLGPITKQKKHLKESVKNFNPDLIITFNHQIFDEVYEIVECPILVWDADSYEFFANKDLLHKNHERVHLVTSFKSLVGNYTKQIGIKKNNILVIQNATEVYKNSIPVDKNISFIGTLFYHGNLSDQIDNRKLYESYMSFLSSKSYNYSSFLHDKEKDIDFNPLFDIRVITLIHLLDLDLSLYGTTWQEVEKYIPQLAYAYNKEHIFSLDHNSKIYNSSKICVSISHPQTIGISFPWRIFDIMASNGCLISSYSQDLKDLTKGWVDIPMFRTPIEARDLCIKLLNDHIWRKEIVFASQEYIEKNARWHHRFKQMEEILGIQLINKDKIGSIKILEHEDLLEKITGYTFNVRIDKVKNTTKKPIKEKSKNIDGFQFCTKIWPRRRINIEIKKTEPNE